MWLWRGTAVSMKANMEYIFEKGGVGEGRPPGWSKWSPLPACYAKGPRATTIGLVARRSTTSAVTQRANMIAHRPRSAGLIGLTIHLASRLGVPTGATL